MTGLLGRTFGGYELTHQLRSDGIAEVFRARPRAAGRDAVVKIIYPEFAQQPGFVRRFDAVVSAANRLDHPHILPLIGSGEQNGYHFLITPFVEGGTLRDWLAEGRRLDAHDVAPFFRQVCEAASYAHSQGVIHGNIKPANMFLHEGRHLLLGDFGRLWDVTQIDMSHAGSGVEAVEYLAPEAVDGTPDQRSDIYSLGAVLFASLSGHAPFRGQTPQEILNQHQRASIPRLADVSPPLATEVLVLDDVISVAMAKASDARYPSALKLAQAIESRVQPAPPRPNSNHLGGRDSAISPPGPVSIPGGHASGMSPLSLPGQPGVTPPPLGSGLGTGPGRPPLGGVAPHGGFAPLPPALEVEPEMEAGRAEGQGFRAGALGDLGELAKLPTTALPGQPGAPPLRMPEVAPVELPTGRVPAPTHLGNLAAPVYTPPPQSPLPPQLPRPAQFAPPAARMGMASPQPMDPAALPTSQMPNASPFSGEPRWTPFMPPQPGPGAGAGIGAPYAPARPAGSAPALAMPAPSTPSTGFPHAVRMVPAPGMWTPDGTPPQPGSSASPQIGTNPDDWFGIEVDPRDRDAMGNLPASAVSIAPESHPYSATRLGLPRLSTPDLGGVAPSWRETVSEPSAASMAFGARSLEQGALTASGEWASDSDEWAESSQWGNGSGTWSRSRDWQREPDRRQQEDAWRDASRPGASTEHPRWAESRGDSPSYSASSVAYRSSSADDYRDDEGRSPRSLRTQRIHDDDDEYEYGRDGSGYGAAYGYDDDSAYERSAYTNREAYAGSSAYLPAPVARQQTRERRAAASQALQRAPSRRIAPVLVLLVLLLLGGGIGIVAIRPQLCPQNRCMAAHAALLHGLAKLGIGKPPAASSPALSANPAHVALQTTPGNSASATVDLSSTGTPPGTWTVTSSLAWLSVTPTTGTVANGGHAQITLKASPGGSIAPQTYNTTIQISSGGTTLTVPVTITVAAK